MPQHAAFHACLSSCMPPPAATPCAAACRLQDFAASDALDGLMPPFSCAANSRERAAAADIHAAARSSRHLRIIEKANTPPEKE